MLPRAQVPKGRLPSLVERKRRFEQMAAIWEKLDPNPRCELYHESPFQLLVSVILSAQTTDKMVNRCMSGLYKSGFTPESCLKMGEKGLLKHIKAIGLAPTKARNVIATTRMLISQHGGQLPKSRDELEALPGVGRKTANVILGEVFGEPTIAVDTHVYRVGLRLNLHRAKSALLAESELVRVIDASYLPRAHHWLILHGRYTCKALQPQCHQCNLAELCQFKGEISQGPVGTPSKSTPKPLKLAKRDKSGRPTINE